MNSERGSRVPISDTQYFDREVNWLRMDARNARWITLAILCSLVLYLLIIAKLATGPINVFHNDALLLLDDGWRVLNGQVPHRDFSSPLGPLEFWIVASGMLLDKGDAQGIATGIAAFGFAVGIWGWLLCRQRFPAIFALLVTSWLVLTATSPTPLGFDPRFLSCAMIYNRQGYALLGIILVECASTEQGSRFWGGVSSGAALILLGFLKLNFFSVGGLLLLASIPIARAELPRLGGFLAGAVGTVLAFLSYPRFSFPAFFSDMSFVAHARGPLLSLTGTVHGIVTCAKSGNVWLVAAMLGSTIALSAPGRRWNRRTVSLVVLSSVVLASGPFFLQTNSLENRCQLASLWIIILLERVSALHLQTKHKQVTLVLLALGISITASALIPDLASALNLIKFQSAAEKTSGIRVAAPGMENLRFYDSTSFYDVGTKMSDGDGTFYANCLNDGIALLNSQSAPEESVLALGFHNPFSYLLRRRPAEGGSSYLFVGNSMTVTSTPAVNRVFGDADLMILPEYEGTHHASDLFIQNLYRPYLMQNFRFVARSQCWSLYRRNK